MEKRIKHMLETLTSCVENQLTHLEATDTKELGEAIDMIKDLEEAMYYCTVTKAMTEQSEHEKHYSQPVYMRDIDRDYGRMYYEENVNRGQMQYDNGSRNQYSNGNSSSQYSNGNQGNNNSTSQYDGRSSRSRRMYMESKMQHSDKSAQMKELENYMQELTQDIVEMVEGSSQEEKQYLSKRIAALANKIQQASD